MRGLVLPFLLRRAPKSDSFVLGHKNIYVFFCREGLLFALLLLVTFVTGVNYGNNLVLGLFFYLLSIWLVSCVVGFVQLLRLSVKLDLAQLCQAQSLCWVQVVVSQKDHKTAHQLIFDFYPKIPDLSWLDPKDKEIFLAHKTQRIALVSGEHVLRLPVLAPVRGAVVLPPLTIKSRYPLGVMQAWGYGHFLGTGQAYPVPLATDIDTQTGGGLGEAMRTGQEDFDRLDSYQSGESFLECRGRMWHGAWGCLPSTLVSQWGRQWCWITSVCQPKHMRTNWVSWRFWCCNKRGILCYACHRGRQRARERVLLKHLCVAWHKNLRG